MFKAVRIAILLLILFLVAVNAWLSQSRSTDWNNSLWVKIYPINADGSDASAEFIAQLETDNFVAIEAFMARETARYGKSLDRPLRVELGRPVKIQPPVVEPGAGIFSVMLWSLKLRWWASSTAGEQDEIDPDVRIFVRYHQPDGDFMLENSIGLQKGLIGIVNARAGRRQQGSNNVIIAHEFLHTLGATDKYDLATGNPIAPGGLAEPNRKPIFPQRFAEIMGGRIAQTEYDAIIPKSLKYVIIGPQTASEIRLAE